MHDSKYVKISIGMKFLLAKKNSMTEIFSDDGTMTAATILHAAPNTVVFVKRQDKDGYVAVQVGEGERKEKNISKSVRGHMKALGNFSALREFRIEDENVHKIGDKIDVTVFSPGDRVEVSAISKGKGFQGVVKLHGFRGGPRTHGQKHSEREPGSIGGGLRTRVPKGMRMAGRMGGERITVKNLKVLQVIPEANEILISGAVPGRRGTLVEIKSKN